MVSFPAQRRQAADQVPPPGRVPTGAAIRTYRRLVDKADKLFQALPDAYKSGKAASGARHLCYIEAAVDARADERREHIDRLPRLYPEGVGELSFRSDELSARRGGNGVDLPVEINRQLL